jgi:hypothetical protein
MSIRRTVGFIVLALSLTAVIPLAAAEESGHGDPVASVVLWLAIVLVAAKIGGDLVSRIGQPAVLGASTAHRSSCRLHRDRRFEALGYREANR